MKSLTSVCWLVIVLSLSGCSLNKEPDNSSLKEITNSSTEEIVSPPLKEITNSIGMKLVLIPPGTFMMGAPVGEQRRQPNETQYEVTISKEYYLGVYEVTQAQYEKVMGENPSGFQGELYKGDHSNHPVETVSWEYAVEFCKRLSSLPEETAAGRVYRLPTEAEWEYAVRAGTKTAFSFGESSNASGDYAWCQENSDFLSHPVGEKKPNTWGLYDMHGNVWEWCSDWYADYPEGPVTDPVGPSNGSPRSVRGGGWRQPATSCRSAHRNGTFQSQRINDIGFRVAMSSSEIPK